MKTKIALFFIAALIASSCSTGSYSSYESALAPGADYDTPLSVSGSRKSRAEIGGASGGYYSQSDKTDFDNVLQNRKIIYNANVTLELDSKEGVAERISEIAKRRGGYMVSSSDYGAMIRVKAENLDAALADIEQIAEVAKKSVSTMDITLQYRDEEIRLENARKTRERYLALLDKATTVEEILKIETELERINTKIETLEQHIKNWDKLVAYSTIDVRFENKVTPGPIGWIFYGLWHGVSWLFVWD